MILGPSLNVPHLPPNWIRGEREKCPGAVDQGLWVFNSCPLQRGVTVTTILTGAPPPDFNIYLLCSTLTIRKDDKRILSSQQTPSYSSAAGTSCRLIDGLLEWGCHFQRYLRPMMRTQIRARWENCENHFVIIVVQLLSPVWLFVTPWTAAHQASLSCTVSQSLLKLMSIESVLPSSHLILCHPLLLRPSIFPSIRVFSSEMALHIR